MSQHNDNLDIPESRGYQPDTEQAKWRRNAREIALMRYPIIEGEDKHRKNERADYENRLLRAQDTSVGRAVSRINSPPVSNDESQSPSPNPSVSSIITHPETVPAIRSMSITLENRAIGRKSRSISLLQGALPSKKPRETTTFANPINLPVTTRRDEAGRNVYLLEEKPPLIMPSSPSTTSQPSTSNNWPLGILKEELDTDDIVEEKPKLRARFRRDTDIQEIREVEILPLLQKHHFLKFDHTEWTPKEVETFVEKFLIGPDNRELHVKMKKAQLNGAMMYFVCKGQNESYGIDENERFTLIQELDRLDEARKANNMVLPPAIPDGPDVICDSDY